MAQVGLPAAKGAAATGVKSGLCVALGVGSVDRVVGLGPRLDSSSAHLRHVARAAFCCYGAFWPIAGCKKCELVRVLEVILVSSRVSRMLILT